MIHDSEKGQENRKNKSCFKINSFTISQKLDEYVTNILKWEMLTTGKVFPNWPVRWGEDEIANWKWCL